MVWTGGRDGMGHNISKFGCCGVWDIIGLNYDVLLVSILFLFSFGKWCIIVFIFPKKKILTFYEKFKVLLNLKIIFFSIKSLMPINKKIIRLF